MYTNLNRLFISLFGIAAFQTASALSISDHFSKLLNHKGNDKNVTEIEFSVLDDTFLQVSQLKAETVTGEKEETLILAQTKSNVQRVSRNTRAVRTIQNFSKDKRREVNWMFTDGFWVVICDQLKQVANVTDLEYYVLRDNSADIYQRL